MDETLRNLRMEGTVLLVEPDREVRDRYEKVLRAAGCEVSAVDGSPPPNLNPPPRPLVILVAGGRDGFDELSFIQQVRGNPGMETAPVILLANHGDTGLSVAALKEGADDIASAPFTDERLLARVHAHLWLARLRQEEDEAAPRAFDQLRLSEKRLRSLVMTTAVVVWNTAADGRIVERVPLWEKFSGQAWEQYRDFGWLAAVHPDDREALREEWRNAIAREKCLHHELRLKNSEGDYRIIRMQVVPILEHVGQEKKIREWVGMSEDVTQNREAAEALRQSEERLRLIMESSTDFAIFTMDMDGNFTTWNIGARRLLGYEEDEILGRDFRRLFIPEDIEAGAPAKELKEALKSGRGADQRWHIRKNGSRFWADGLVMPLRDKEGETCGFLKIIRDFTEQKRAVDELKALTGELDRRVQERTRELEESRSRLSSLVFELNKTEQMERQRIAAELHDGLAQLLTAAQLSLRSATQEAGDGPVTASLKEVRAIISEATRTTRDLMSELSGPQMLEHDDLLVTIRWAMERFAREGLSVELRHNKPRIPLDRDLLILVFQAVRELLLNVRKHSGSNKTKVDVEHSGQMLKVTVSDDGRGFDPEQGPSEPGRKGGFGLLNIQERLQWLGGGLEIDSSPGEGTRNTLVIPLVEEVAPAHKPPAHPTPPQTASPPREKQKETISVLLVDDHCMVREGFRKVIEEVADLAAVGEAADGLEAIEKARLLHPDVVLMDINMPRMNGLDATRRLKEEFPDLTVIGLSLHRRDDIEEAVKEAGAAAFICKEEAFDTLCEVIRSTFHNRKS